MRHAEQAHAELEAQYWSLTRHIQAVDIGLGRALDQEERLVLQERRADLVAKRDHISAELSGIETALGQSVSSGAKKHNVDDNELWRLIGEMRGDMKVLELRIEEVYRQSQNREVVAGLPSPLLYMILAIGVMLIILMIFISMRIGLTGWIPILPIWQLLG